MQKPWIFFISAFYLTSNTCYCQNETNYAFYKEIAKGTNNKERLLYSLRRSETMLKLDTVQNGFDSIEIRLWFSYSFISSDQLLVIKNKDNNWSGLFYDYRPLFSEDRKSDPVLEIKSRNLFPGIPWTSVIDTLYKNNILTLPNYTQIKDYYSVNDPDVLSIEVSTRKSYRLYIYPSPINTKSAETTNIENILNFLAQTFDLKYKSKI